MNLQINDKDFLKFDYIFGMDDQNIADLKELQPHNSKAKILLLGTFDIQGERIIKDPYFVSFLLFSKIVMTKIRSNDS